MTRTILLFAAIPAFAHDLYLMPETFRPVRGSTVHIAFHNGDAFPDSESNIEPDRLRDTVLRGRGQSAPLTNFSVESKRTTSQARVDSEGCLIATAATLPRRIELEPAKFESYLKEESLDDIIAWRKQHGESQKPGRERYSKYIKSLLTAGACDEYHRTVIGFPIEIIPEDRPAAPQFAVRILFRGKPAAGLALEVAKYSGGRTVIEQPGKADASGRVVVRVERGAVYKLHALKMERRTGADVDWESFWATLTLRID